MVWRLQQHGLSQRMCLWCACRARPQWKVISPIADLALLMGHAFQPLCSPAGPEWCVWMGAAADDGAWLGDVPRWCNKWRCVGGGGADSKGGGGFGGNPMEGTQKVERWSPRATGSSVGPMVRRRMAPQGGGLCNCAGAVRSGAPGSAGGALATSRARGGQYAYGTDWAGQARNAFGCRIWFGDGG